MSNSSEDDINVGENSKNIDIDSFKNFFNYLKSDSSLLKKKTLIDFLNKNGITETDNRLVSEIKKLNEKITEEDFFEDPNKSVNSLIENHPKFQEFQQFQAQQQANSSKAQLEQTHPDFMDIVQDTGFQDWVQASKFRTNLFQEADAYNYEAADELLTHWKERSMIDKTEEVKEQQEATRKKALKTGKSESKVSSESTAGKKTYRRADLIRLKATDPNRYADLADEIYEAYAEGRVK